MDIETTNADIPYADTFFVVSHICLVRVSNIKLEIFAEKIIIKTFRTYVYELKC